MQRKLIPAAIAGILLGSCALSINEALANDGLQSLGVGGYIMPTFSHGSADTNGENSATGHYSGVHSGSNGQYGSLSNTDRVTESQQYLISGDNTDLSRCKSMAGGEIDCTSNNNRNSASTGASSSTVGNTSATGGQSSIGDTWSNSHGGTAESNSYGGNQTSNVGSSSASVSSNGGNSVTGHTTINNSSNRYLNVRPVTVAPTPIITPAANVSRYASQECGPRQQIVHREILGINNRALSTQQFSVGDNQYIIPADEPYRRVELVPGLTQLLGHRVVETAAVITISTGGGLGASIGRSSGSGGSAGYQSSGAVQTTQRGVTLIECVAYEVDTRLPMVPGTRG